MNLLLIPGSLRKKSFNKSLIRHISEFDLGDVELKVNELNDIPMFNEDLEGNLPQSLQDLIQNFKWADAVLIATPEYNNSLPAPVRNMIHWMSRSYSKPLILNMPISITGVTDGGFGTVRAQNELILMATVVGFDVKAIHRLPISYGAEIFNNKGDIIDKEISRKVDDFVKNFIEYVRTR